MLRKGTEEDIESIRLIAHQTWPDAYKEMISTEQINYMLQKMYNKNELLSQFMQGYVFLLAAGEDKDLGFAVFSNYNLKSQIYKLHKLYVLPQTHGQGVGKLLIDEVINVVRRSGGKTLALNVNRKNKAVEFYQRMGFNIKETVDLDIGDGFLMNDYLMEYTV